MPATVYLGGGGTCEQEGAIWRLMLADRPRVLYWPFALDGQMLSGAEEWLRASLQTYQRGLEVDTWVQLEGHQHGEMAGFDLLFIGGGNTFELLARLREHGALEWVRAFTGAGGHFYGGSAGAILAGASIEIATWYDENTAGLSGPENLRGLALLGSNVVLPHFTPDMLDQAQRWAAEHAADVLAVPDSAGLVVVGDQVTVAGSQAVWRVSGHTAITMPPGATFTTAATDTP